jgi:ammonium transporter, Amt family
MKMQTKLGLGALATALAALPALAQDGPIQNPTVEQMATMVDKGDTTWMLVSSVLVLMMAIPALALFYGGLVRTKNMLSLLMQVLVIVSVGAILWIAVGYSLAFTPGSPYIGGLSKAMLAGVGTGTYAATFSNNVYIPEYAFVIFQMTFACITPALIIGAFAERIKFWPLILFCVGWTLLAYYPIAHMVWFWAGPDFLSVPEYAGDMGLLWGWGALDFAGGTVVHINAGIAGLVGCYVVGKRIGHNKEPMPPHSLTLTMVGASLLWVGWFGFNAGSNLESNGLTALAFLNTFVATAAATLSWVLVEQVRHGRPSLLGAVTGAVAGLVAITPAAGFAAPGGALILGLIVSPICYIFVSSVKKAIGYDWYDYTVFPAVAGTYDMAGQIMTQIKAVCVTVLWTGIVSFVLFYVIKLLFGLRPSADDERQGLDQTSHGESAYNY